MVPLAFGALQVGPSTVLFFQGKCVMLPFCIIPPSLLDGAFGAEDAFFAVAHLHRLRKFAA